MGTQSRIVNYPNVSETVVHTSPDVLFVDHSGALGGAELYLLDVARALQNHCSVALFEHGPFASRLETAGVKTRILRAPEALRGVRRSSRLTSLLRTVPATLSQGYRLSRIASEHDVIYANSQKALVVSAIAGWLSARPVIWNLHDILTADHFSRANRWLAVGIANVFVNHVVVNSEATRRSFIDSGGRVDTTVVYNGIEASNFEVDAGARSRIRSQLGVSSDQTLVGVFSRLAPWKGQHVLIEALSYLPELHAVFVGDALFEGDEAYTSKLRSMCEDHGISDRVHFVGFQDDVGEWMSAVDIVAHTSTSPEPFGRVVVEGMLAGRPIVATAAGGVLEIVDDDQTGCLVPPGDAQALARTLRSLIECPAKRKRMARVGRRYAESTFSVGQTVQGIEDVLKTVHPSRRSNSTAAATSGC